MTKFRVTSILVLLLAFLAAPVLAENEGQNDLDEATQLKATAKSLADLEKVAQLCEGAIKKGLDEGNTIFAEQLLSASLMEYSVKVTEAIFERKPPHPQWPLLRRVATKSLERAVELNDSLGAAHVLLAKLYTLPQGDAKKAQSNIGKAVELFKDDKEKLAQALVVKATIDPKLADKLKSVERALEADPGNAEAWQLQAAIFMAQQDFDKAIESLNKLVEKDDNNATAHKALAEALAALEKFDDAIHHVTRALEINEDDSAGYALRGRIYAMEEKYEESIADLDTAVKKNPQNAGAILFRARVHLVQENLDRAKKDVNFILQINPTFSEGLVLRSMISAQEKNYTAAIADMEKVLKQDPSNLQWNLQLGGYLATSGRPRKAVELFTKLVEKNPKSWQARRARADTLLTISDHKSAVADYEIALKEKPDHSGMLNNLAWVLATAPDDKLRNGKRAVELATAACEGTKYEAAHILSTLAAAYGEIGDFETAKKWSRKAVELGGDDEVSEQLKKELESYENKKPWREAQKTEEKPNIKPSTLET